MPNITVRNLTNGTLSLPGMYYTAPVAPNAAVTFEVPDTDEFINGRTMQVLITGGSVAIEYDATDAVDRPLSSYTTAALPAATSTAAGTVVWNTTERNLYICDGTAWSPMIDTGAAQVLASATLPVSRFVGLNTSAQAALSPVTTERWLGVTTETIVSATTGRVQTSGQVEVMPAANTLANGEMVAMPGGLAAPFQVANVSLGLNVAGANASDDILQTNLNVAGATVHVTCGGNSTGNSLIVYGTTTAAPTVVVRETILLGPAGVYTGTNVWAAIYGLRTLALSVGTIDIRDGNLVGLLIPQIPNATAARFYGAVVPGVTTNSVGHRVTLAAGGANTAWVVIYGTDYAGIEQLDRVQMTNAVQVTGTLAFRAHTFLLIGADGIAWNAGVTSQYTMDVLADSRNDIRAYCVDTNTTAGATSTMVLLPQNLGLVKGKSPIVFWTGQITLGGGAATEDEVIPGLLTTDIIQATILSITQPLSLFISAAYQAANTVRFTFSANPVGAVMHVTVYRP